MKKRALIGVLAALLSLSLLAGCGQKPTPPSTTDGDTPATTIAAMIADEAAIGMINGKTTAVRVIPVPGKTVGDVAVFGGLLGEASIIRVPGGDASGFVKLGGRIPAPIHSLRN